MKQLKVPTLEKIEGFKTYGNKYVKFWHNVVTSEKYNAFIYKGCLFCAG